MSALRAEKIPFEWALAVQERGTISVPTRVLIRGNAHSPGAEVEPGFLEALGGGRPAIPAPEWDAVSTGRRRVLAGWIASPANPLTARVAVNRIWQHYFGQGIVKTTADFGKAGASPTHPELLDWLAAEFVRMGWSSKQLHRLILLSQTYRMSSRNQNERALALDPGNDLLWRQRLRRLEAEGIWDASLCVSGELNSSPGGRGFYPHLDGEVLAGESRAGMDWEISSPAEQARRSLYIYLRRSMLLPLWEAFDYSNTSSPLTERPVTTVAPQALMLLNGDWAHRRAAALADRLGREAGPDPAARVQWGYRLALGRAPTAQEAEVALRFIERQAADYRSIASRLTFRPDVPNSLYGDFMKQLKPGDFLRGPRDGWSYYAGRWSTPYEGIRTLDRPRAPFALWQEQSLTNVTLQAGLYLHLAAESASVLLRSEAVQDEQRGYEVLFDARRQCVSWRRHDTQVETVAEAPAAVPTGRTFPVRIELAGPRLRLWMKSEPAPVLDAVDAHPVPGAGKLGVRSSGSAVSVDDWTVSTSDRTWRVHGTGSGKEGELGASASDSVTGVQSKAWQSFGLLLMNLNEFIYVD